jgi:hypothetical protein
LEGGEVRSEFIEVLDAGRLFTEEEVGFARDTAQRARRAAVERAPDVLAAVLAVAAENRLGLMLLHNRLVGRG